MRTRFMLPLACAMGIELFGCERSQLFDVQTVKAEASSRDDRPGTDPATPFTEPALSMSSGSMSKCPVFRSGRSQGRVKSAEIDEASGLAASRRNPGVLWIHNDSGDLPRLFALQPDGELRGVFKLPTSRAVDWEDIAIGPGKSAGPHLYIGDIGDNTRRRSQGIIIHRVPEPRLPPLAEEPSSGLLRPLESFRLRYPDGPQDAETLLVDPESGEVVLLTKSWLAPPRIYFARSLEKPSTILEGGDVLDLRTANVPALIATAGDVSPDGRWVIVRSYGAAYLWKRQPGQALHEVFSSPACSVPLEREPQGEALGFAADGRGYFTLSEKRHQPIFHYALEPQGS